MKRNLSDLLKICQKYLIPKEISKIKKAYQYAAKIHCGQKRKNEDEFIQHPLHTSLTLAGLGLDSATISAGLLHDTVEDGGVKIQELEKLFGSEIKDLVLGVTKVGQVKLTKNYQTHKLTPRELAQLENLRKMFLVMARDIRVILIRLADRLHNMQTLYALEPKKQKRIAKETLEIYAPIAYRLGMGEIKGQLEDLAFPYTHPQEYKWTKSLIRDKFQERQKYLDKVIKNIEDELKKTHLPFQIHGRAKHLYSLYKKLLKYDKDITKIYDLMAIRIITDTVSNCYKVLGIIHKTFRPLIGYIKDYIAIPKPNGYQSLHTTIFALEGQIVEIQIRTYAMHEHAEFGVAAHWHYSDQINQKDKQEKRGIFAPKKELKWISELAKYQQRLKSPVEFKNTLKMDFFQDRIFVFTPEGEVINLPEAAGPIDFAYEIHSDIGDKCSGAKVSGKMASLDYRLKNGEMVEILTSPKAKPTRDWLNLVKTAKARSRIRSYLKKINK